MIIRARKPGFIQSIWSLGSITFKEVVRDRVLYNSLLCATFLILSSYLASKLTHIFAARMVLDIGLAAIDLSGSFISILIGSFLIGKEIDRRTAFVVLSKPISRLYFILGKLLGLELVVFVNWIILSICYLLVYKASGGEFYFTIFIAISLVLIQSFVLAAISLFFSTFSTGALSATFSFGLYILGKNINQIRFLAAKEENEFLRRVLDLVASLLPDFEIFSLGTKLTYDLPVTSGLLGWAIMYGVILLLFFSLCAGFSFHRKEI